MKICSSKDIFQEVILFFYYIELIIVRVIEY